MIICRNWKANLFYRENLSSLVVLSVNLLWNLVMRSMRAQDFHLVWNGGIYAGDQIEQENCWLHSSYYRLVLIQKFVSQFSQVDIYRLCLKICCIIIVMVKYGFDLQICSLLSVIIPPKTLFGGYIGVSLSVGLSVPLSVRWWVCSFLSAVFLINYWTNFIQTSQVNSVSSRDVHMKFWLWFIDFSLSYGPFTYFAFLWH